jgi:methylmalonyl-CoA mutase N-terminal domain/subunit
MRTVQILMEEANLGDVADPLGGSYYIERLTTDLENAIVKVMDEVDKAGGAVKAIENGLIQRICARGAYERQKKIDSGERVWVGANKYVSEGEDWDVKLHEYDPTIQERQIKKLNQVRKERDHSKVQKCLKNLKEAAVSGANIVPPTLEAVKAYATVGEMTGVLREVFGEFKEPAVF